MNPLFAWIGRLLPRSLQLRLSLLVIALLVVLVSLIGVLSSDSIRNILTYQIGRKALILAQAVAFNPMIREVLQTQNPEKVTWLVTRYVCTALNRSRISSSTSPGSLPVRAISVRSSSA